MATKEELMTPVEPPQIKGGKSFNEALAITQPYISKKSQIQSGISKAEGEILAGEQKQKEILSTAEQGATKQMSEDIRSAQEAYQRKLEAEPIPAFIPTKDSVQDIAGLFSLIGVIGMVAGKDNAQLALGNMNGMLEGYQKGRADLYKKEAIEFDKNFKGMLKKHEEFRKEMEDAIKLAPVNKEAAMAEANLAAVKAGSSIVKAKLDKGDLLGAYKLVDESQKGAEHALQIETKAREQEEAQKFRKEQAQQAATLRRDLATIKATAGTAPAGANVTNDLESSAQAIANYAQKPPGLRDKQRSQIMARVREINPKYNEMDYGQRDLAMRNYTNPNGTGAKQLQAFTTVAGHLESLEALGEALNNKDTQLANRILNYISVQTGNPEVTNFKAAKQAVSAEVVKAITGTAGALSDRKEAESIFGEIQSPEQIQGAIDTVKDLIYSRLETTRAHYASATGRDDFKSRLPDIVKNTFVDKKRPTAALSASAPQAPRKAQAPPEAVQYLKQHPEFKEQFKTKYGYLPEGM